MHGWRCSFSSCSLECLKHRSVQDNIARFAPGILIGYYHIQGLAIHGISLWGESLSNWNYYIQKPLKIDRGHNGRLFQNIGKAQVTHSAHQATRQLYRISPWQHSQQCRSSTGYLASANSNRMTAAAKQCLPAATPAAKPWFLMATLTARPWFPMGSLTAKP